MNTIKPLLVAVMSAVLLSGCMVHKTGTSTTLTLGKSYMTSTAKETTVEACGLSQAFAGTIWNVAQVASFLIGGRAGGGEAPASERCGMLYLLEDSSEKTS